MSDVKALRVFSSGFILASLACCQIFAASVYQYRYDDGSSETLYETIPASYQGALSQFAVVPGAEVITAIDVAFANVPNGLPVSVYLWSDPNGDGNPSDATVLASASGVSANTGTNVFNTFALSPTILPIGDNFFVGVIALTPAFTALAGLDNNSTAGKAWYIHWLQATPDPNNLVLGSATSRLNVGAGIDPPGDWMIRADAAPVPEPATSALMLITLLLLLITLAARFRRLELRAVSSIDHERLRQEVYVNPASDKASRSPSVERTHTI